MKFLSKHNTLRNIIITVIIVSAVYGVLLIVSTYQKAERDKHTYGTSIEEYDGEVPTYNVDGMSEEEIMEMLEQERQKRNMEE